ncbi:D-sedoheptulose-7-phosphate isomerase [Paucilactobacillus sp. N302-9]
MSFEKYAKILVDRRPVLKQSVSQIEDAYEILLTTVQNGGTIFTCGNGGSNADSYHIVGELLKSFEKERPLSHEIMQKIKERYPQNATKLKHLESGIKAIALGAQTALVTAFANDVDPDLVFGQELLNLGSKQDTLICLSTSGDSKNVMYAAMVAEIIGMEVILITGQRLGDISSYATKVINVPETETYKVQELHIPIYHCLCLALEDRIYAS